MKEQPLSKVRRTVFEAEANADHWTGAGDLPLAPALLVRTAVGLRGFMLFGKGSLRRPQKISLQGAHGGKESPAARIVDARIEMIGVAPRALRRGRHFAGVHYTAAGAGGSIPPTI